MSIESQSTPCPVCRVVSMDYNTDLILIRNQQSNYHYSNKLHIISKGIRQILENLVPQHWSFTFLKICSTSTSASQKEVGYRILGSKSEPKLEAMEPNFIINMTWARFIRLASL